MYLCAPIYKGNKRAMVNYANGVVYAIRSRSREDLVYVGSTTVGLAKRLGKHRCGYKQWLRTGKGYVSSFEVLAVGDEYIELLEGCPCDTRQELSKCEGKHMRALECVNKRIEGRTQAEYRAVYRVANADQIRERKTKYHAANADQIREYKANYYAANADKVKEQVAVYRAANHNKILARKAERVVCECGAETRRGDLAKHRRTKKHRAWFYEATYDFIYC